MNKLNQMLVAGPLEFAAIFGEATSNAATDAVAGTSGLPPGAIAVVPAGPATGNGQKFDTPTDVVDRS